MNNRRVVIFADNTDCSVIDTARWLKHYKVPFVIVNDFNKIIELKIELPKQCATIVLTQLNNEIIFDKNTIVWYRNGSNFFSYELFKTKNRNISFGLDEEIRKFKNAFFSLIEKNVHCVIGSYLNADINKIEVLEKARLIGFNLPKTEILLNTQSNLITNCSVITKSISEIVLYYQKGYTYTNKTRLLEKMESNFFSFPTLIQENINKLFEVRVFYFFGTLYSMAIFSQKDQTTSIDYRNYNYGNINRCVPIEVNIDIKRKVKALMKIMGLNTASIDFIVGLNFKYYFLEVNPNGQYGFLSSVCNFKIEKIIANRIKNFYEKK
jgi:ATP-GRASP peptide maturase of grasp-with-spasm system